MDKNPTKETFSEEEAINITLENGYDGSELNTSTWINRGCLKPNRSLDALISKLETIYNHVEVIGKGKKRQYILRNKKNIVTERQLNYKGSLPTEQDEIMKEYIFNKLIKLNRHSNSYKGWSEILKFPSVDLNLFNQYEKTIKELHAGFPTVYNPKDVISKFYQSILMRNKDIIERSFQRLQKENIIIVTEIYNIYTNDNTYDEIDKDEFEYIQAAQKEFLEQKGSSLYIYTQSLTNLNKSKDNLKLIREVEEFLIDNFNVRYMFKSFKVVVLDYTQIKLVTIEEFYTAYYERYIKLSEERQAKETYNNTVYFWRKFYLLNTLTLLDYIGIEGLSDQIKKEKISYYERKEEYSIDWTIHQFEMQKQRQEELNKFNK
jgi:hypothetical protein